MSKSISWDYSDVQVIVKGTTTIPNMVAAVAVANKNKQYASR